MFKCGKCMRTSVPGEKATRVTVETREVTYVDGRSGLWMREIAKEMTICQQCKMMSAQKPGEPVPS